MSITRVCESLTSYILAPMHSLELGVITHDVRTMSSVDMA
jgi:hypothetical protein